MRVKMSVASLALGASSLAFGCACGARGASYSGSEEPALVSASEVREEPDLPEGYDRLGEVTASCRLDEARREQRRVRLSDLDCTEQRLVRVLREAAAKNGGELLIGLHCSSQLLRQSDEGRKLGVRCSADVARPSDDALAARRIDARAVANPPSDPGLSAEQVAAVDDPHPGDAWRIGIDFTPAQDRAGMRPARRADLVRELSYLPVSHVRLGDLVARCRWGCAEESVRESVRIAAGRLGATDVVGVSCIKNQRGFTCTGTAAAYEVDPESDPRAR